MKDRLSLRVEDVEDLKVMSAALQDAVVRIEDLTYLPKKRRFAGVLNRFRWENEVDGKSGQTLNRDAGARHERVRTGFHFDGVEAVRAKNILQDKKEGLLSLLAIQFDGQNGGEGEVALIFSGGGMIVLKVECIEASFQDLSESWSTPNLPHHGTAEEYGK